MARVTFRFYQELNDFIAPQHRQRDCSVTSPHGATTKHMIEALGVPHTEVELIIVNGESVGFERVLCEGDRIAVYPMFEAHDITPLLRVREHPLRVTLFLADAQLGGLARLLRLAGFDTRYANGMADGEIEQLARAEHRIVLTRDRELLMRRGITHGCYVRALRPCDQLRELFERLDLARGARPFTLCLLCNAPVRSVDKASVESRLPPTVRRAFERFTICDVCHRVFWEGSHWRRMRSMLEPLLLAPNRLRR